MLRSLCSVAMVLLAIAPFNALGATAPLEVTLRAPDTTREAELGIVLVTVSNQSDRPLLILMADSALITDGDHLFNDVMTVTAADGHAVAYHGRAVRPALGNRQAYATLAPGESKESRVDLPANYAVDGGTYTVTYTQRYGEVSEMDLNAAPAREAHSNVLTFYANANLIQAKRTADMALLNRAARAPGPDNTCQETKEHPDRTTINNARSLASSWAFFGYSDVGDLYGVSYAPDASGKIIWRAKLDDDVSYTTWFGTQQDTSPSFPSPPKRQDVWDAGDFLPLHVTKAIWARVNSQDSYSCGCAAGYDQLGTAAWTEETVTHICAWFWNLPFSTYGVDNQVLTIVHENGHHADSYGPYVGDHEHAYGRNQAKTFASTNREKALVNADNYAYYIEAARMKRDKAATVPPVLLGTASPAPVERRTSQQ